MVVTFGTVWGNMQNILTSPLADDTTYYSLGPVHTYPDIFESTTFLSRCGFHPHVSGESGTQMCKVFNPLSRVEIFEYAINLESHGHQIQIFFLSADVTRLSPVLYREYCIQDGNLIPRFCLLPAEESTLIFAFFFNFWVDSAIILDANFAHFTMHALLPIFPEEFSVLERIRIRVGFVWTGKFILKVLNPQRKIGGLKNIQIHVDGGLRLAASWAAKVKYWATAEDS